MVETTESRDAAIVRMAMTLHEHQFDCNIGCRELLNPDLSADFHASSDRVSAEGHLIDARSLYDAGLRSTSRDSEVREAIEALPDFRGRDGETWPWISRAAIRAILDRSSEAAPTVIGFDPANGDDYTAWRCNDCGATGRYLPASEAAPVVGLSEAELAAAIRYVELHPVTLGEGDAEPDEHLWLARAILARLTQTRTLGEAE